MDSYFDEKKRRKQEKETKKNCHRVVGRTLGRDHYENKTKTEKSFTQKVLQKQRKKVHFASKFGFKRDLRKKMSLICSKSVLGREFVVKS